jgi:L-2-hydroxyglutarate oxidase LhgO
MIVPFRGSYYTLAPRSRALVRGLVYPVPDPALPFLGVHFTRRLDGEVLVGPNAVLALARDGYQRGDISARDLACVLGYRGFWRMAFRYVRAGLVETWRDVSKRAYLAQVQRYIPSLTGEDLRPGPSGVRAQAVTRSGVLMDDFSFIGSSHIIHVQNAPSPAATSSLAIGRLLAECSLDQFGILAR